MGLLDKIRRKKSAFAKATADRESKKPASEQNVLDLVKEPVNEAKQEVKIKEDAGSAYRVLKSAHLSEKTTALAHDGRYVFKVNNQANKIEIAKAVEKAYDVHVVSVNIVTSKGKIRRMGRRFGRTSDWKKAIVTLKTGERIQGLVEGI